MGVTDAEGVPRDSERLRTVIVGCGGLARTFAWMIREDPTKRDRFVGFICEPPGAPESLGEPPILGQLDDLPRIVEEHYITSVMVLDPDLGIDRLMAVLVACSRLPVQFSLTTGPREVLEGTITPAGIRALTTVPLRSRPVPGWHQALKRGADVLGSVVLLALTAPVWLIVPLIRRATGAGAIFRQERIGLRGEPFTMLKFRTMVPSADPYAPAPSSADDERVTRVGRWLRRYSLDELPQLINVLRGEMSLVGPRPEMRFLVERYEPWQRLRLEVKPGLTGLWQIMGRKDLPLVDNIELDFLYMADRSPWTDLMIALRTIPVVLRGRGAY